MSATPESSPLRPNSHRHQCQVTRAVQTMSTFNRHHKSMKTMICRYFYSPTHFPKILGGIMLAGGIIGYTSMGWWHGRKIEEQKRMYIEAYHNNGGLAVTASAKKANKKKKKTNKKKKKANKKNDQGIDDPWNDNEFIALARRTTNAMDRPVLQRQMTKFW